MGGITLLFFSYQVSHVESQRLCFFLLGLLPYTCCVAYKKNKKLNHISNLNSLEIQLSPKEYYVSTFYV